jgi:hypothetical protein
MQNNTVNITPLDYPLWLRNFIQVYQSLSTDNLPLLSSVYDERIIFSDPVHTIEGFDNLYDYFENLYQNLVRCDFVIHKVIQEGSEAAIYWTMTYQHVTFNKGRVITIEGSSHIKGKNSKVFYHKDYLDLGAMIYEQLPVVGRFIRWVKHQVAK